MPDNIYPESVKVQRVCFSDHGDLPPEISDYVDKIKRLPVRLFEKYKGKGLSGIERMITCSCIKGEIPEFYVSDTAFVDGEDIATMHGERWKSLIGIYNLKGEVLLLSNNKKKGL
jgi:hypothetical protein